MPCAIMFSALSGSLCEESTLNFKCPVVVNPDSRRAIQVILESDAYHMRHRLAEFQGGKAGTYADSRPKSG